MPNIFDGLEKTDIDSLRYQLASLEEITVKNVMGEMGQKAQRGAVKVFNGLRKLVNSQPIDEPRVISMEERVDNKCEELKSLNKDEIMNRMQAILTEKVNSAGNESISGDNEEELSAYVITLAAKCFKKEISEELSPAQKADAIYHRYNERLVAQTKKKYDEASKEEKEVIDRNIEKEIDSMSREQKEELRKALGVEEITGDTIGKLIKSTAGATTLLVALEASGFGAYMALTTIIHAIFTTTLGITLPFAVYTSATGALSFLLGPGGFLIFAGVEAFMLSRNKNKIIYELLAQVVWTSVMMCGGRFTSEEELLPSWVPEEQKAIFESASAELHGAIGESDKVVKEYQELLAKLKESDAVIAKKEVHIQELIERLKNAKESESQALDNATWLERNYSDAKEKLESQQQLIDDLQGQVVDRETLALYETLKEEYATAEKELKKNQQLVNSLSRSIKDLNNEVELYESELESVEEKNRELTQRNAEYERIVAEKQEKLEHLTNRESGKLEQRWEKAFRYFIFEPGVIKSVVKNYQFNEYGSIESVLIELHEAKDPAAIRSNRGKMAVSEELHLGFSTKSGFPSRIFFKPIKNQPDGKKIVITKICKHNDPRYGK